MSHDGLLRGQKYQSYSIYLIFTVYSYNKYVLCHLNTNTFCYVYVIYRPEKYFQHIICETLKLLVLCSQAYFAFADSYVGILLFFLSCWINRVVTARLGMKL